MKYGIFILLLMTCSCLPIPFTTDVKPQICGVVVDAETEEPIDRVDILYESGEYRKEYRLKNKQDFKVGPLKQWHFLIYLGSPGVAPFPDSLNYLHKPAILTFSSDGYQTHKVQTPSVPLHIYNDDGKVTEIVETNFEGIEVLNSTQDVVKVYMKKEDN